MVRFKNRYLLVQLDTIDAAKGIVDYRPAEPHPTASSVASVLRTTIGTNFGQYGTGVCSQSLSVKFVNGSTGLLIVRAAREHASLVAAALALSGGERLLYRVVHVAGTIRAAQRAAMRLTTTHFERALARIKQAEPDRERAVLQRKTIVEALEQCRKALRAIDA